MSALQHLHDAWLLYVGPLGLLLAWGRSAWVTRKLRQVVEEHGRRLTAAELRLESTRREAGLTEVTHHA